MHNVQSPRVDDAGIEAEIVAKGLTAPRITPLDIDAAIAGEVYFTAADGALAVSAPYDSNLRLLTFCVLTMRNGFAVTGESACASPENFDADVGKKIARANAVQKMWPLLGYELRSKLHAVETAKPPEPTSYQDRVRAERAELDEKAVKLSSFLATEQFSQLKKVAKDQLLRQYEAMLDYLCVLEERIEDFGAEAAA